MTTTRTDEKKIDKAVEDSFPASDPPASSGITGPRIQRPADEEPPAGDKKPVDGER